MKTLRKDDIQSPAIFHDRDATYRADTCEPLKNAARTRQLTLTGFGRNCYPGQMIPPGVMPELSLACVWDAEQDQPWGLETHRNEGIEFGFLSRGSLSFRVDGRDHQLKPGALTVTRPWQPHRVGKPNVTASRMHWLILDLGVRRPNEEWFWPDWMILSRSDLNHLTELLRFNEEPVWIANSQIESCFENIARLTAKDSPQTAQTRLRLCINELFIEVYELLKHKNIKLNSHLASTRRSVEIFLKGLREHVDYPWTLENMAGQCNLGRSRFSHHCKLITNMTPANYLMHCRVQRARELLTREKSLSITEIAFQSGFESSQYFCTVFKNKTGHTPSSFRRKGKQP